MFHPCYHTFLADLSKRAKTNIQLYEFGNFMSPPLSARYNSLLVCYRSQKNLLLKNSSTIRICDIKEVLFNHSQLSLQNDTHYIDLVDEPKCEKANLFYLNFLNGAGSGVKVKYPVAYYEGKTLHIYWLFLSSEGEYQKKILEWLVKESLKKMGKKEFVPQDETEKNINNIMSGANQKWLETTNRKMEELNQSISQWMNNITASTREISRLNKIKKMTEDSKSQEKEIHKNIENIKTNKQIRDIRARENNIHIFTQPLTLTVGGESFKIGSFEIIINLIANEIHIFNELRNSLAADLYPYDHPHIKRGKPCWGSLATTIPKSLGQNDLADLVCLIIEFLLSYNQSGAFINIYKFTEIIGTNKEKKVVTERRRRNSS